MKEFLNWILPLDKVNVTDVKKILLILAGNVNVMLIIINL
jgi:hypothetical protein